MSVKEYLYALFNVVPMSRHREMLVKLGELEMNIERWFLLKKENLTMIKKLLLLVALLFMFAGCAQNSDSVVKAEISQSDVDNVYKMKVEGHTVIRFVDTESEVVCYLAQGFMDSSISISCLPLSGTSLDY